MTELLLGGLLLLAVVWLIVRVRQNNAATKAESRPEPKKHNKYQAVAIQYSENACDAAKVMTGRRYLINEAPRLPLADCDFGDCRCKFAYHDDRRSTSDRRSPFSNKAVTDGTGTYARERRARKGRRKGDAS
jgi:hypothetical protein